MSDIAGNVPAVIGTVLVTAIAAVTYNNIKKSDVCLDLVKTLPHRNRVYLEYHTCMKYNRKTLEELRSISEKD